MSDNNQIVLMNGPTCAGKSTIARLIQDRSPVAHVLMQIDAFEPMLPRGFKDREFPGKQEITARFRHGFHDSIAAMAHHGNRVIADTVLAAPSWLDEWLDTFRPFSVLFVGVFAQLDDLKRREAERARHNDVPGTAERQFHTVHEHDLYDIRLDTSRDSAEACAQIVLAHLQSDQTPTAFGQLRTRRQL